MARYKKLPVVIDAHQLPTQPIDGTINEVYEDLVWSFLAWCSRVGFEPITGETCGSVLIHTLEGTHTASPGDWIIKGVKGEFTPVSLTSLI